jgi:hypothetical protein
MKNHNPAHFYFLHKNFRVADPDPNVNSIHLSCQTEVLKMHLKSGVYILVENGYLFPPPPQKSIFFPKKNSVIFAQHCRRQIA